MTVNDVVFDKGRIDGGGNHDVNFGCNQNCDEGVAACLMAKRTCSNTNALAAVQAQKAGASDLLVCV